MTHQPPHVPICPICGNLADKKNLHLIPWFIIKNYITQGGSGERDKELSFTISTDTLTKVFTGRSVLPEKIEDLGDLHEAQQEKNNPYTRDNLWCTVCEKKFSRLEAIFATRFSNARIIQQAPHLALHNEQALLIDNNLNYGLYELFIQTIFWRCSIGKFDDFSLHPSIEKKLLTNIQEQFARPGFTNLKPADDLQLTYKFPLLTFQLHTNPGEDPTNPFILINKVRTPYFIMAGKWLFQLFEKEGHIKGTQEWLYGLRITAGIVKLFPEVVGQSHVVLINAATTAMFTGNQLKDFVQHKIAGLRRMTIELHRNIFGFRPDNFIIDYVQRRYFQYQEEGKSEYDAYITAFFDLKKLK